MKTKTKIAALLFLIPSFIIFCSLKGGEIKSAPILTSECSGSAINDSEMGFNAVSEKNVFAAEPTCKSCHSGLTDAHPNGASLSCVSCHGGEQNLFPR